MSTIRNIETHKINDLKSSDPKTGERKAAKSLRDGLRARSLVLPTENAAEFQQLCDDLEAEWQPQSGTEKFYLELMASSQWKMSRNELEERSLVLENVGARLRIPLLSHLSQSQARLERSFIRAQRELERLQKSRRLIAQQIEDAELARNPPAVTVIWQNPDHCPDCRARQHLNSQPQASQHSAAGNSEP